MEFSNRFKEMHYFISKLQNRICNQLEEFENKNFVEEEWKRVDGGGGTSRIIENGKIIEKSGVNMSSVYGMLPINIADKLKVKPGKFAACGISLIIHPYSPKIPTVHMNVRFFEMKNGKNWFGGGIDLTPYYPHKEDFIHFHKVLKKACNSVVPDSYRIFKNECDNYFTIEHRNEIRGIGGIFFDYLEGNQRNFNLTKSVGNSFLDSYIPILQKRKDEKFDQKDKEFQLIRRGRYVEFNL